MVNNPFKKVGKILWGGGETRPVLLAGFLASKCTRGHPFCAAKKGGVIPLAEQHHLIFVDIWEKKKVVVELNIRRSGHIFWCRPSPNISSLVSTPPNLKVNNHQMLAARCRLGGLISGPVRLVASIHQELSGNAKPGCQRDLGWIGGWISGAWKQLKKTIPQMVVKNGDESQNL